MKHKGLVVLGVFVAAVLIIVTIIPFLIDANRYRPEIESRLSESLGRPVKIGNLKLSIFSGGITANNITIGDDPAFGTQPFVTAKELTIGVALSPLIFHKQLNVESLNLYQPVVRLLQSRQGKWNVSTIGQQQHAAQGKTGGVGQQQQTPAKTGGGATPLTIKKLEISNGRIEVGEANGRQEAYSNLNLQATDLSPSSTFPFALSLAAPKRGELKLVGKAGPLDPNDVSRTPFSGNITVTNFDLAATGFVSPNSGLAGILDYNGTVKSNGRQVQSQGKATASKLRLVKSGTSASQPIQVDYHSNYNLARESGVVDQTTIHTGKSTAALSGTYDAHGATSNLNLHFTGNQMATGDIEGLLPALGVVLPAGSSLQGGTISADLAIRGPSDQLVTTGTLNISNTRLAGFSMSKGLSTIAALTGLKAGSDTTIQVLSSNLRIAPEGIRLENVKLVVPDLGSMTGGGTIAANSALDFRLVARLNQGGASPVGMLTSAFTGKTGIQSIPIRVTGTTEKPVFLPDVGAAVADQLAPSTGKTNQQNPIGGLINGLLGGKKKK